MTVHRFSSRSPAFDMMQTHRGAVENRHMFLTALNCPDDFDETVGRALGADVCMYSIIQMTEVGDVSTGGGEHREAAPDRAPWRSRKGFGYRVRQARVRLSNTTIRELLTARMTGTARRC